MINKEVTENRNKLVSMMAVCEDITRTNHRILELLRSLMHNPEEKENIKVSIKNLVDKVKTLQGINLNTPLIEEEETIVPGPEDISISKEDINVEYQPTLETLTDEIDEIDEVDEVDEVDEPDDTEEVYQEEELEHNEIKKVQKKQVPPPYAPPPKDEWRQKRKPNQKRVPLKKKPLSNNNPS